MFLLQLDLRPQRVSQSSSVSLGDHASTPNRQANELRHQMRQAPARPIHIDRHLLLVKNQIDAMSVSLISFALVALDRALMLDFFPSFGVTAIGQLVFSAIFLSFLLRATKISTNLGQSMIDICHRKICLIRTYVFVH